LKKLISMYFCNKTFKILASDFEYHFFKMDILGTIQQNTFEILKKQNSFRDIFRRLNNQYS
jgi:hypothetical protein